MKKIKNPSPEVLSTLLERPGKSVLNLEEEVQEVFQLVRKQGDEAVAHYTRLFDGVMLDSYSVTSEEFKEAEANVSEDLKKAIATAKKNITAFHEAQKRAKVYLETAPGIECWMESFPIPVVGLYVPGGTAPLFSTVLMLSIPAVIAGCNEIIICSPPNSAGKIDPSILYTAELCGITKVYKVGGIQAVAAMTFGTKTIPKVDKIFGPGNPYVTAAKQMAFRYGVAIDMPAGPSELMVYADGSSQAEFVSADLLSQAEHGGDSQVILVTTEPALLDEVEKNIGIQMNDLPRKKIIKKALDHTRMIAVASEQEALDIINAYAPEHLIVVSENEEFFLNGIRNAGSVFLGNLTPESAGDYASGTNHTLPTNGFARQFSGLNLDAFCKTTTFQKLTETGVNSIGSAVCVMADAEGLEAHKRAMELRIKSIQNEKE